MYHYIIWFHAFKNRIFWPWIKSEENRLDE